MSRHAASTDTALPWSEAEEAVRLAIRRRSILALRDLYADFAFPPALDDGALPALDEALAAYGRARRLLGEARLHEVAANIGLLAGAILVSRRGGHWVVDPAEERLGVAASDEGPEAAVAEPVRWALERAHDEGPSLEERAESWLQACAS